MALSNKWLMTRYQYFVDFFTIPLFIAMAIYLSTFISYEFAVGVLGWTLVEYLTHRFLFHGTYRREHWMHHVDVEEYIGIQGWKIALAYTAGFLIAAQLGLLSVFAGFAFGYLTYITLHYFMHRPDTLPAKYMSGLIRNHNLHHEKGIEKNFGVTSPLWDYIFRTKV